MTMYVYFYCALSLFHWNWFLLLKRTLPSLIIPHSQINQMDPSHRDVSDNSKQLRDKKDSCLDKYETKRYDAAEPRR